MSKHIEDHKHGCIEIVYNQLNGMDWHISGSLDALFLLLVKKGPQETYTPLKLYEQEKLK